MAIKAIEREKVCDVVFNQMRDMILDGEWKPGEKIPSENELRLLFNVSRVTIREALKKLASYNIVETRQGSGSYIRENSGATAFDHMFMSVYVNNMDDRTIWDMMEFRRIIEVESVSLATQRAEAADLLHLSEVHQHMLDARDDIRKFSAYDLEFHKYIAEMTKNIVLIKCYAIVWDFLREYFNKVVEKIGVEKGSYYHGEILRAMEKKDRKEARRLMREHLDVASVGFFEHSRQ